MFFKILLKGDTTKVAYETLAKASAVWKESGCRGSVVAVGTDDQVLREYSSQESDAAASIYFPQ